MLGVLPRMKTGLTLSHHFLTNRVNEYEGAEIRFNLMVVEDDQRQRVKSEMERLSQGGDGNT